MWTSGRRRLIARRAAAAAALACLLAVAACGDHAGREAAAAERPDGSAAMVDVRPNSAQPLSQRSTPASQTAGLAPLPDAALDVSGWVLAPPFYAAGDEPYWKLDIVDSWFVFRRSGLAEIEAPLLQPSHADGADVFNTPPLTVTLKREACQTSQGGHGDVSAQVVLDQVEYAGCAFGGISAGASAEASAVIDALGPIDACLAELGQPALVTAVYPREGERTAVALRARDGSLYECAAEADGRTIAFLDPIEPRAAGAWMSRMRFLRTGSADAVECADAEDVRSGEVLVGRLLTKACKF